ncbi:MAG TPA: outer membrane beta-barrel protein [Chthoniobacterales bacterium]|jgi:predicted porin
MKKWSLSRACGILSIALLVCSQSAALGEDPTVEVVTQNSASSAANTVADWLPSSRHVEIFTEFHTGYDDNSQTTSSGKGGFFTGGKVTLTYHLPSRTTQLSLVTAIGATEYFAGRTDGNGSFDLSLIRHLTRRLTFNASIDAAYRSEPDFNQNIGPNRFNGSYFSTIDKIWASYALSRRLSLVSSYNLKLIRYEQAVTASFTDREEHTFGEQLRYNLTRRTVLTGEYRLLRVDYVTNPSDSTTDFALAGIEHRFNPRLRAQIRAGLSYRSFDQGGDETNPDFEGSLDYVIGHHSDLSWTGSYSVEAPTERNVVSRTTFRTGLHVTHSFTGKISSSLGFAYHHDENQEGLSLLNAGPMFSEDSFDLLLKLQYKFSHRLTFDIDIDHSQVSSGRANNDYSRNHYSIGLTYKF